MRLFISLTLILTLFSCSNSSNKVSTNSENSASIDNVIEKFCEASSSKNEKMMTDLVYPKLFSEQLDKAAVQYMFLRQLQATERFKVTNIQKENSPKLIYTFKEDQFYMQAYYSDVDIKISESSTVKFEDLVGQMVKNDPNAVINYDDQSMKFSEKRKIILVENPEGTYVLPEIFIDFIALEGLNNAELKAQFQSSEN